MTSFLCIVLYFPSNTYKNTNAVQNQITQRVFAPPAWYTLITISQRMLKKSNIFNPPISYPEKTKSCRILSFPHIIASTQNLQAFLEIPHAPRLRCQSRGPRRWMLWSARSLKAPFFMLKANWSKRDKAIGIRQLHGAYRCDTRTEQWYDQSIWRSPWCGNSSPTSECGIGKASSLDSRPAQRLNSDYCG